MSTITTRTFAVLLVAALVAVLGTEAGARTPASKTKQAVRPTIVLVHGAWADGSSWSNVTRDLQRDDYTVAAPPNPLRGLAADSASIAAYLSTISGPIVLVGHSYGGTVITNAALGNGQVKALVYVDAFIPAQHDTLLSLTQPGSCFAAPPPTVFDFVPIPSAPAGVVDAYVKPSRLPRLFGERPVQEERRRAGRRTAPARNERADRGVRRSGLGDDPLLGRDRHGRPRHHTRLATGNGKPGEGAHHEDRRAAPLDALRPARCREGHRAGRKGDVMTTTTELNRDTNASPHHERSTAMNASPNIVLVHGAWADGSSWSTVIECLQADGYTVTAPQFPMATLADDVARLREVLARQDRPTIVVGHSYGGQIMTALGTDAPNVVGLVFIAAFGLDEGESIGALVSQGPPSPALAHLDVDQQGFAWLPEDDFVNHFAADVDPIKAKVMYAVQQPLAGSALGEVMGVPAWKSLPSWYLVADGDQAIPPDAERQFAKRMGATTVEVSTNHVAMVSHPDDVVKLVKSAAESVAVRDAALV